MAARLLADQDKYDDREHRAAFTVAFHAWPLVRGRERLREIQIQWAGTMLAEGLGPNDIAYVIGVEVATLTRRRILAGGESWRDEVLNNPPAEIFVDGVSRLPRVVEGRHSESLLTLADRFLPVGDCWVNLPPSCQPPTASTEADYVARLQLVRSRRSAA